ncbi:hypothetical protein SAMN04487982_105443 [Streptomyces sp. ok210]|nr:hypothetical protein SAMN04487982_105443 [Streptomyces sp. ok210]
MAHRACATARGSVCRAERGPPVPCPEAPDGPRGSTARGRGLSRDPWWVGARRRMQRIRPTVPLPEAPDGPRGSTAPQGQALSREPRWIGAQRQMRRIARRRGVLVRTHPGVRTTWRGAVAVVAPACQGSRDSPWVPGMPGRRAIPNGPPHIARASEMSSSAGRPELPVRRRLGYQHPTGSNSPDVNAGHGRASPSAAEDGSRAKAVGRRSVRGSAAGGGCRPAGCRPHG